MISSGVYRFLGMMLTSWVVVHSNIGTGPNEPGRSAAISRSRLDEGLPPPIVDLHPDRPDQRGIMTPAGTLVLLNPEPTFEAIESAGGRVTKHSEAHVLAGFFFVSGEIERVTSYEAGFVGHHTVRDGHTVPDPLILDERFLAARVRGRGVRVLSPCSHAGVVNAALGALGAFAGEPIDVILGGYHLVGEGMEPRIEPTVHDLANRVSPRVVAPGHCTGWRAKAALAHAFAPGNYGPSVVGSLYALRATRAGRLHREPPPDSGKGCLQTRRRGPPFAHRRSAVRTPDHRRQAEEAGTRTRVGHRPESPEPVEPASGQDAAGHEGLPGPM